MDFEEIKKFADLLEEKKLSKINLKKGDFEILLEKSCSKSSVVESGFEETKPEPVQINENKEYITSPMVGTFYNAANPTAEPFVKVGDVVSENTVVAIIEAMKVMNEVKAGICGKVTEILCKNAHPVEYGTKLFAIKVE